MLRCLGYSATIAIAVSACKEQPDTRTAYQKAFDDCITMLTGAAHAATAPVIAECREQGLQASGMSASGQDPKGLEAKAASPVPKGDAQ
jgi:hypothetical protein